MSDYVLESPAVTPLSDVPVNSVVPDSFNENRRSSARHPVSRPAVCYSVLRHGEIDTNSSRYGAVVDVSKDGLRLEIETPGPNMNSYVLVGVETDSSDLSFYGTKVVGRTEKSSNVIELNLALEGETNDLLQNEMIFPVFDRNDLKFHLPFSDSVLKSLAAVSALQYLELDTVKLCPACQAVPTMRDGCSQCLSANVGVSKMIHHYACANVDLVEKFEFENEICCPKCRGRKMIVGADFEYLNGPFCCLDCGQNMLEPESVGHCLACNNRFAMSFAEVKQLIGYRVNRLDILDFVNPV